MSAPSVANMVFLRLPFLDSSDEPTITNIGIYELEIFYELQKPLCISNENVENEATYSGLQRSMVADLIAAMFVMRQALINMEGTPGVAPTSKKILKKAAAGSADAEWEAAKASDGNTVLMNADKITSRFMADANRKARTMGFIFNIAEGGILTIELMSQAKNNFMRGDW